MMAKQLLIEQKLKIMDASAFQNLCDAYLKEKLKDPSISFNKTGSQIGKQKTVKGTPDTFFRLTNGELYLVEYTTTAKDVFKKIKKDIERCINYIETNKLDSSPVKIICCFNSRITIQEDEEIYKCFKNKSYEYQLINIDILSNALYFDYKYLAKTFLDIPLDTGQLLTLENFVYEYEHKAKRLSTPLSNVFFHRETELASLAENLIKDDIIIITGQPGVGKTKIALETVKRFQNTNRDYTAFALSNKDQDISEDLHISLKQNENFILLIDDANRQLLNFQLVFGILRGQREGNIKLVMTVRDYALDDLTTELAEYDYKIEKLVEFTREEINQIIKSKPFEIHNWQFQNRIHEISKGNIRVAIMAAKLANEKQYSFLYESIPELYDYYYKTFIKDFDIFKNQALLKTFGLISFFYAIDLGNIELIDSITSIFKIDKYAFEESINELHERELIEKKYNHIRVSEQVMATYFFYRVFISDAILSFKDLLSNFFPAWGHRFLDSVLPLNSIYGYKQIKEKIAKDLMDMLSSVSSKGDNTRELLKLFGCYVPEKVLSFSYSMIESLPEPVNPNYTYYYNNSFTWQKNKDLELLYELFDQYPQYSIESLELAFEYCRKKTECLSELIYNIIRILKLQLGDERINLGLQVDLFNLVIDRFYKCEAHYVIAFWKLAEGFLCGNSPLSSRKREFIEAEQVESANPLLVFSNLRTKIWETIIEKSVDYQQEAMNLVASYGVNSHDHDEETIKADLMLLIPFLYNTLDCNSFKDIHYANVFAQYFYSLNVGNDELKKLNEKFRNDEYSDFLTLIGYDVWYNRNPDLNANEIQEIRVNSLRSSFIFENELEFVRLIKAINNVYSVSNRDTSTLIEAINIICQENITRNIHLGAQLLKSIIYDCPQIEVIFYKPLEIIINESAILAKELWDTICSNPNDSKLHWQLIFFECLPTEYIDELYVDELIRTIYSIDRFCQIDLAKYEKYNSTYYRMDVSGPQENILFFILNIIYIKIETKGIKISVGEDVFRNYKKLCASHYELFTAAYLKQCILFDFFDHDLTGLKVLIGINSEFLLEFIKAINSKSQNSSDQQSRAFQKFATIWDIKGIDHAIEAVLNYYIKAPRFYYAGFGIEVFFEHLNEMQVIKAGEFLLNYIRKYNNSTRKMKVAFAILNNNTLNSYFERAFVTYLELNKNISSFKKIPWIQKGVLTNVGNRGDHDAFEWKIILKLIEKCKDKNSLFLHKQFVNDQIQFAINYGNRERERDFARGRY